MLLSSAFLVLAIILYLLGMHRATSASAISQSLLTNRRSPHLLFTAGFPNHFNTLMLEDALVDSHKYLLPPTCIRFFLTKHYWGLFVSMSLPCSPEKQSWQPACFHGLPAQTDMLVLTLKVQQAAVFTQNMSPAVERKVSQWVTYTFVFLI